MKKPLALLAMAVVLAACTSTGGDSADSTSPAASVATASPGEVADYVDNKSRCTAYWNYDTTANVQLKNLIQRVGVTPDWQSSQEDVVYLRQDGKNWPSGASSGLAGEGEYDCKAVPWAISNDASRVYDFNGGEWTGAGDNDFYWGHTQTVSGAPDEPNGWVKFTCVGALKSGGKDDPCPEKALASFVKVEWDAENDDWTKLEKAPKCGFSTSSAVGCWETGKYGGQYEGQFNFNAFAWTAPLRLQLSSSARDDSTVSRPIVWEITKAVATNAIWPYGVKPEGALLIPGPTGGLVIGAYATPTNGYHGFTLTLEPKYVLDASGAVQKVSPTIANRPIATVSVGVTLSGIDDATPPTVTPKATKDVCTINPKSSGTRTYSCDVESAGTPFTYGGAWSASIKTG